MPLQAGDLLYNRYRVDRVLGQGGMGAVYLAADESLGLQVAVKENLNVSPESERQFKREATLLATLRHAHLPRVTNHFVLANQQYLVMDYVEGQDLRDRLSETGGRLPEADVVSWTAQICDALTYLHGLNPPVVHRDIKPGNIKLNAAGEAMLVDFGIAKSTASGQKTTTGASAFTPGYAPPEQYGMGRTDPRTDQYALAATVYTLLTGQTPPDSMERLLGNMQLPPPDSLRDDLSPAVSAALQRALELRPDDRFESVAKFKEALQGKLELEQITRRAASSQATQFGQVAQAAAKADTVAARPAARLPGWAIPALVAVGLLAAGGLAVVGGGLFAVASQPTATPTLAPATPTAPVVAQLPSATSPPPATETPPPPTDTPTPAPTDTAPPVPTATIAGTPVGSGGRIAFISNRDGQRFQVYTMNPDGSDVQQLTFDDRDKWSPEWRLGRLGRLSGTQLAWSPDGTRLLYVAEGGPGSGLDLWMINADGSNAINLTAAGAGDIAGDDFQPSWCPADWIAFTTTRVNNTPQVFMMQPDNRRARNFSATHASPIEFDPAWFPDCQRFLLVTTQNGIAELWRVFPFRETFGGLWQTFPPASQQSYRVFLSDIGGFNAAAEEPAISPDGQFVLYTRRSGEGNDIILTTVSDSQFTMLIQQLTVTRNNSMAQWSPDGKWIAFVSRRDGGDDYEIYRMNVSGAQQTNLTNSSGSIDVSPAWQPAAP